MNGQCEKIGELVAEYSTPPQRLPLGIPTVRIAKSKKGERAGGDGKREMAGAEASLPLFPLPIVPRVLSFFLVSSLPTTQRGLCGRKKSYTTKVYLTNAGSQF